ncbi:conserved hypothetical protein [Brucella sp. F5/99]|nr:conserved hypothetical protein [Brucella sp. F5/99]
MICAQNSRRKACRWQLLAFTHKLVELSEKAANQVAASQLPSLVSHAVSW